MSFISPVATDASGNAKTTGSQQSLGKDDFLHLLVTKLQNQDPLKPMEDQDFIAQLAQFSSLEQMNNISEGIATSNKWDLLQMQSLNNALASGLIGKEIKAEYSGAYIENGKSTTISFTMPETASQVELTIKDASGNVVTTLNKSNVGSGVNSITWDATDNRGNRVDDGFYTVEAKAIRTDGSSFSPSLALTGKVTQVVYRDGNAYVKVNGIEIPLGDIAAVGEAGTLGS
ncbi:flagellar biosynthesis protein FlgD [candidate division GN15 bacterium]|uniref:Basal-body rod modification protein FlgD n=1 Tax=candidate division GN15 bacterium TaxID=2072418 RepID=A0A855X3U7_9BACT|nr:MAG: flagellar biosynthesis protein FlgD [candidate division GN15 bacterium]